MHLWGCLVRTALVATIIAGALIGPASTPVSLAQETSQQSPLSQLTGDDRALYQRAISVLRLDPDYQALGHTSDADWTNLAARSDCLTNDMQIRNPDPGMVGRPQLEAIVQIDDLLSHAPGTLIGDLAQQKDTNAKLKTLAGDIRMFSDLVQDFTWFGLFKAFGSIGFDQFVAQPLQKELTSYTFNSLYNGNASSGNQGYADYRDKWGSKGEAVAHMIEDGILVEGNGLYGSWKSARVFFMQINDKAQLGWDDNTITNQLIQYLDWRYLSDVGAPPDEYPTWLLPKIEKPADGMENTLRDALHTMKLQLMQEITSDLNDSCWQAPLADSTGQAPNNTAPSTAQSGETPVRPAPPQPSAAPTPIQIFVYLLGGNGGIGFYLGTDADVNKTPSCAFTGGGLCGSKDPPLVVYKKILGPYSSVEVGRSALKQTLECHTGYWGPTAMWEGKGYWLQNNVGTGDCKTVK